jgi:hypothetical protein
LRAPPADTQVLLGYVKSPEHHAWIRRAGLYNLRADSGRRGAVGLRGPELSVEYVALHGALGDEPWLFGVVDEARVMTAAEMESTGYVAPGGALYFCLPVVAVAQPPEWWTEGRAHALWARQAAHRPRGSPVVVTWRELVPDAIATTG